MAQASQVLDNRPENKLGLTSNLALEQYSNTNLPPIDISRKEATQNKLIRSEFASDKLQMTKSPMLQPTNKQALSVIPEQQQRNFPEQHQRNFAPNLPNQYSRPPPPKKEGMFSFLTRKEKPSYPPAYNRQIDQYPQNYPTAQKYPPPGPQQEPYQKYSPAGPSQDPYSQKYIPGPAQDIYSQKYLPKEPLQSQPDPFLQRNPPTGAFSQQDPHSQKYPSQREIRANSDPRQGEFPVKDYRTGDYKFYSTVKQAIPQNYPKTGFEKLMSCNALTMRPIFNVEDTASCMTTMNTFYIYPGVHSREQYSIEPMFVVRENTNSCAKFCLT